MPHSLPRGVVRAPDGTFQSIDDVSFEEYEVVNARAMVHVDGHGSGVDPDTYNSIGDVVGEEIIDMDDILDRRRDAVILNVDALWIVQSYHSGTGGQSVIGLAEISTAESRQIISIAETGSLDDAEETSGNFSDIDINVNQADTFDLIAPPLGATSSAEYEDETNGAGGPGTTAQDRAQGPAPVPMEVNRRDSIFLNANFAADGSFAGSVAAHLYAQIALGLFKV